MAATGLHISISAEPIFHVGSLTITNSILTSLVVSGLIILFAFAVRSKLSSTNRPQGLQNVAEFIIESLYNLVHSVAGSHKKARLFFPMVASFFLFIIMNNYFGLLPGVGSIGFLEKEETAQVETTEVADDHEVVEVKAEETEEHAPKFVPLFRAGTADLNTTIALALVSMIVVQVFGVKFLHLAYFKKFIDFSNPINFFVGILEIVSEFAKVVSFAFRLFGNIFAGEVLLAVITFLVPIIAPMPFYGLELFVGFIQALVFSMLSLVFFNMATISHDEH